ncbi:ABC transporter permease [Halothermothrix orenii]|nr:ABC transporter permease [Halothermothrix orenii]
MFYKIKNTLFIIKAEIIRYLQETFSYRVGIISDIIVLSILYLSLIFLNTGTKLGLYYQTGDSPSLLLLGYIFWSYSISAISRISSEIRTEQVKGTLQQKFMAIIPFNFILIGTILSNLMINSIVAIAIIIISKIIAGVNIIFTWPSFIALLITLAGMYGIALIFGAITLRVKKIGQLVFITQVILLFISDTMTKTYISESLGKIIPLSAGIDLARKAVGGLNVNIIDWSILITVSTLWLVVGIYAFKKSQKYVKKHGLLNTY